MRELRRIPEILSILQKIWYEYPDLRLCQLISNIAGKNDIFYIEDDILLKQLKEYSDQLKVRKKQK